MNHPVGYLLGAVVQYIIFSYVFVLCACLSSLGFGCFCFSISMTDDVKNNLNTSNEQVIAKENPTHILKQYSEFIELHTNVHQLSRLTVKSTHIWQCILFALSLFQISCWLFEITWIHGSVDTLLLHRYNVCNNVIDEQRNSWVFPSKNLR